MKKNSRKKETRGIKRIKDSDDSVSIPFGPVVVCQSFDLIDVSKPHFVSEEIALRLHFN